MTENKEELSVDEILESVRLARDGKAEIKPRKNKAKVKNKAKPEKRADEILTDDATDMDASTVFGDYDGDIEPEKKAEEKERKAEKKETPEIEIKPEVKTEKETETKSEEKSDTTAEAEFKFESNVKFDIDPEIEALLDTRKDESENSDEDQISETETAEQENKSRESLSFKELFQEKKRRKTDVGKTRVFSKPDKESSAADGKTRVISAEVSQEQEEDEIEKQFNEARQEKIDKFRLFTENITDSPVANSEDVSSPSVLDSVKLSGDDDIFTAVEKAKKPKKEHTKRNELMKKRNSKVYEKIDVGRVKLRLKNEREKLKTRSVVLLVGLGLTFITELLKAIYTSGKLDALAAIMDTKCVIFYAISLVLAVIPVVTSMSAFIYKLQNSEKFEFTNELYLVVVSVLNVFYSGVMLVLRQPVEKSTLMFSLAVFFISLVAVSADMKENKMILKNLNTITKNEKLLGIYPLTKNTEKLAGGISSSKEPNILCQGEVEVPNSFMDSSTVKDKQNGYLKVIIPLMVVFGIISGALAAFSYGGVSAFAVGMMSAVLLCCPAFLTAVLTSLISNANDHLNISGCEILGYEAVEYIDDTDAIVLDTADIFTGEMSHFHVINSKAGISTLNAFQTVCAMLSASGGILSKEVESLMKEQKMELPEVDDLKYEERLGLSCWVNNKCALLGTRQMMINHNIEVPPEYTEKAYIEEGKKVFYFAVDTQVVAMFCCEYFIGRQTKKQLEKLYKTGVILMLMTTDPNIDEEFVAATLNADPNSIKTVSSTGTQAIRKEINKTAKQKRTGLIFKRNITGSLKVINAAFRLYDVQSLTLLIQTISIVFAFVLTVVLNAVATKYFVNEWLIIGYHIIWTVLALFMTSRK